MTDRHLLRLAACLGLLGTIACTSDAPTAASVTPTALRTAGGALPDFLSLAPDAAPLAATTVSFYAVKGQDREVFIWYQAQGNEPDSSKLVRFRVTKKSLCNRPDGSNLATGDSLLITLTVTDADKQIVKFEPAGLLFCAGRPAKLNMWYEQADHDFDDDGDVDSADTTYEAGLSIWKQEHATAPWQRIVTVIDGDDDEAEASITGFTSYVVAY